MAEEYPPIIVTAQFDAQADDLFQRRRQEFFPPQLNFIPAHLTLFHNLPGDRESEVVKGIAAAIEGQSPITAQVPELMSLGRGVAYRIVSDDLKALRGRMIQRFDGMLVKQDRQGFRPHVTIQNKVSPGEAKGTRAILEQDFASFPAKIEAIQLWHYRGGPWSPIGVLPLQG
ncbi:2'-5' RNA ligase family protein [Parvularcula flava]|nr:2'-5' RNA ligase family protein [Aquisalinus luteolus]NHK28792.1 2'-5' RNA ligase family protein [Aquisalinus luteolus]